MLWVPPFQPYEAGLASKGPQMSSPYPLKGRRVVVTGGAGMIGSHLVRRLVGLDAHVVVIDNLWRGRLSYLSHAGRPVIDLNESFHQLDLAAAAPADIQRIFDGADTVFHLADVVAGIDYVFGRQFSLFTSNMQIDCNTLKAAVAARVPNYVYVGSACAYPKHRQAARNTVPLREDEVYPAEPESAYGWSKLKGEYIANLAQAEGLISTGILRLHNVYGPNTDLDPRRARVIPSLIRKALLYPAEPFVVWGSGRQRRAFVFVDDVVEALLRLRSRAMGAGPVQFGPTDSTSIAELASLIARLVGRDIQPIFDADRPEGDFDRIPDLTRCRQMLDMVPQTTLDHGLARVIDWVREQVYSSESVAA